MITGILLFVGWIVSLWLMCYLANKSPLVFYSGVFLAFVFTITLFVKLEKKIKADQVTSISIIKK